MKFIKVVFLLSVLFLQFISCKDTGTGPNQKPFEDPRQMTWTADTLSPSSDAVQLIPESMIAFFQNDIWLACWSDVAKKVMWHHDGKTWTESDIEGQSGPIGLNALAGNSSSDLWAGGFYGIPNSFVALSHYNGSVWSRVDLKIPGEILDMCTDGSGNIWACGNNGVVLEYTQGKWIADTIRSISPLQQPPVLRSIQYYKDKISIIAGLADDIGKRNFYYYITGDMKNWKLVDSMVLENSSSQIRFGNFGLYLSTDSELYSYGLEGIWRWNNSAWEKVFDLNGEVYGMCVINKDYIITGSAYKKIFFYNGGSWISLSYLFNVSDPTFVFKNFWTNGYEIFIAGYGIVNGIQKTIIWHGK